MSNSRAQSPGERLLELWRRTRGLPFGDTVFAWIFARTVPYSGSTGARVIELTPGRVRVSMSDRRAVRNHLNSIHAIALANLGEMASGLAMSSVLPGTVRAIVVGIDVEYMKKARGTILADSVVQLPDVTQEMEHRVVADLVDAAGDRVARVTARWRLRPV